MLSDSRELGVTSLSPLADALGVDVADLFSDKPVDKTADRPQRNETVLLLRGQGHPAVRHSAHHLAAERSEGPAPQQRALWKTALIDRDRRGCDAHHGHVGYARYD
jgi:hypothetical protein